MFQAKTACHFQCLVCFNIIILSSFATGGGRIAGFMVFVSSTDNTDASSWTSAENCYRYPSNILAPNNARDSPLTVSCNTRISGRYVTIYNERLPGQQYYSTWSSDAVLILCEVEIEGRTVSIESIYTQRHVSIPRTCRVSWAPVENAVEYFNRRFFNVFLANKNKQYKQINYDADNTDNNK